MVSQIEKVLAFNFVRYVATKRKILMGFVKEFVCLCFDSLCISSIINHKVADTFPFVTYQYLPYEVVFNEVDRHNKLFAKK
mmetsp:Transcript_56047/g.67561  ORF Transcript_56047/g.67561 Transcript_56047/m.67561 type:complete len:81 (+) Transcript_56047:130-372(+)